MTRTHLLERVIAYFQKGKWNLSLYICDKSLFMKILIIWYKDASQAFVVIFCNHLSTDNPGAYLLAPIRENGSANSLRVEPLQMLRVVRHLASAHSASC